MGDSWIEVDMTDEEPEIGIFMQENDDDNEAELLKIERMFQLLDDSTQIEVIIPAIKYTIDLNVNCSMCPICLLHFTEDCDVR